MIGESETRAPEMELCVEDTKRNGTIARVPRERSECECDSHSIKNLIVLLKQLINNKKKKTPIKVL